MAYIEVGTTGSALRTKLNNNLSSVINLMDYGAIADGTGNNITALQNAIDAANTASKPLYIPTGTYLISSGTLTLYDDLEVIGDGFKSVINYTANTKLFNSTSVDRITIRDLKFKGSGRTSGSTSQIFIYLETSEHFRIDNCRFEDSGGVAVHIKTNYQTYNYNSISNCQFINNKNGLFIDERAEYTMVSYCDFSGNDFAVKLTGGNNNLIGCNINKNGVAVTLITGTNDSHGSLVGCNLNHNTTIISSTSIQYGFIFSACNMFEGNINLISSPAITFDGCHISTANINLDASNISIVGGSFITSVVIDLSYNGNLSILKYANILDKSTNDWYVLP